MSKKGLSYEDKKIRMMEIFTETKDFFTLKDLEKIAPKTKGIVQQTVKEVLLDLVGDSVVQSDKIGTSIYYWAFPSTDGVFKRGRLDKGQAELSELESKIAETETILEDAIAGREESTMRTALLSQLQTLQSENRRLEAELEAFGACDPIKLEQKKEAIQLAKESALRWTENTMTLIKMAKDMGMHEGDIYQALDIDENWEELVAT